MTGPWEPAGAPSDDVPEVLAAGRTDADLAVVSLSARHPEGDDAAYLAWHALDHRPEQHRLAGLRGSARFVSTPACREARAASSERYDAVDHAMVYLFAAGTDLGPFFALGAALRGAGRMALRLPPVELGVYAIEGRAAAPDALVGADVVPWRPASGAYLLLERGPETGAPLPEVSGTVGTWWYRGAPDQGPTGAADPDLHLTIGYLDGDPAQAAAALEPLLQERWRATGLEPLLAAPFWTAVPGDWHRHLP